MIKTACEKAAVVLHNIWFAYPSGPWVLQGVSFSVPQGTRVALLGASGTGKTTLLKILAGLLKPQQGSVQILGHSLEEHMSSKLRQMVGYIPQQLGLIRGLTVLENTLLGAIGRCSGLGPLLGRFPNELLNQAEEYLKLLGLGDKIHEKVMNLSGGQRQRVAIARTLMQSPRLILADEFVSDLDVVTATQILEWMVQLSAQKSFTLIMSLHNINMVRSFTDKFMVLKGGRIVVYDTTMGMQGEGLREILV